MKSRLMIILLVATVLAVAGGFAWTASRPEEIALAEFSVQNLSCGSCVQNIRTALEGVKGVGGVEVSVTSSRARVEYVPGRIDTAAIAERISGAGYPAVLSRDLSAADYKALREDASRLADRFVGRIGEKLISRDEFAAVLARFESNSSAPRQEVIKAVWGEILQEELLLAAAEKNAVVVQEGEVDLELRRMREADASFSALQARYGGEESLRGRVKKEMIIRRNLDEHVLAGISDEAEQRSRLTALFRTLSGSIPVIIFDPALKAAVEGGGKGCGKGCCG